MLWLTVSEFWSPVIRLCCFEPVLMLTPPIFQRQVVGAACLPEGAEFTIISSLILKGPITSKDSHRLGPNFLNTTLGDTSLRSKSIAQGLA